MLRLVVAVAFCFAGEAGRQAATTTALWRGGGARGRPAQAHAGRKAPGKSPLQSVIERVAPLTVGTRPAGSID